MDESEIIYYDFSSKSNLDLNETRLTGAREVIHGIESPREVFEGLFGNFMAAMGFSNYAKPCCFARGVSEEEYYALEELLENMRKPNAESPLTCGTCEHCDTSVVFTSYPPKYKCKVTGNYYTLDHECPKVEV